MNYAALTSEEWDELLDQTWNAPVPRLVIRIDEYADPREIKTREGRLAYIEHRKAEGALQARIARELGVDPGVVSKLLKGKR